MDGINRFFSKLKEKFSDDSEEQPHKESKKTPQVKEKEDTVVPDPETNSQDIVLEASKDGPSWDDLIDEKVISVKAAEERPAALWDDHSSPKEDSWGQVRNQMPSALWDSLSSPDSLLSSKQPSPMNISMPTQPVSPSRRRGMWDSPVADGVLLSDLGKEAKSEAPDTVDSGMATPVMRVGKGKGRKKSRRKSLLTLDVEGAAVRPGLMDSLQQASQRTLAFTGESGSAQGQPGKAYRYTRKGSLEIEDLRISVKGVAQAWLQSTEMDMLKCRKNTDGSDSSDSLDLDGSGSHLELDKLPTSELLVTLEGLGRGCGGNVHRAIHATTLRFVAVKEVTVHDDARLHQIVNEIKTLRWNLTSMDNHMPACENVVSFYDAYMNKNKGKVMVVLEMCSNGSLQDVLNNVGKIPETALSAVTLDILRGMAFIHGKGLLHRDIKPGNILLTLGKKRPVAKIADFGLVKDFDASLQKEREGMLKKQQSAKLSIDDGDAEAGSANTRAFIGTPIYMSPERLQGQPYSYPSDVWSIGLTLLTCALGKYPADVPNEDKYWHLLQLFSSESTVKTAGKKGMLDYASTEKPSTPDGKLSREILEALITDSEELRGLSSSFVDFLACCLQKNPKHRLSCEELLQHKWVCQARSHRPETLAEVYAFFEQSSIEVHDLEESAEELDKICRRLAVWHKAHMHRQMSFLKSKKSGMGERKATFFERIGLKSKSSSPSAKGSSFTSRAFTSPRDTFVDTMEQEDRSKLFGVLRGPSSRGSSRSPLTSTKKKRSVFKLSSRGSSKSYDHESHEESRVVRSPSRNSESRHVGLSSSGLSKAFNRKRTSPPNLGRPSHTSQASLDIDSLVDHQLDASQLDASLALDSSIGSTNQFSSSHSKMKESSSNSSFASAAEDKGFVPPKIDTSRTESMMSHLSNSSGKLSIRSRGSQRRPAKKSSQDIIEGPPWGTTSPLRRRSSSATGSDSRSPSPSVMSPRGQDDFSLSDMDFCSPKSKGSSNSFSPREGFLIGEAAATQPHPGTMVRARVISGGINFARPRPRGRRTQSVGAYDAPADAGGGGVSPSVNPRAVKHYTEKKKLSSSGQNTPPKSGKVPRRRSVERPGLKILSPNSDSEYNQSTNSIHLKNEDWDENIDRDTDQSGTVYLVTSTASDDVPDWDSPVSKRPDSSPSAQVGWDGEIDGRPPRSPDMRNGKRSPGGILSRRKNTESSGQISPKSGGSGFRSSLEGTPNLSPKKGSKKRMPKFIKKAVKSIKNISKKKSSSKGEAGVSGRSVGSQQDGAQLRWDSFDMSCTSAKTDPGRTMSVRRTSSGISDLTTDSGSINEFRESEMFQADDLPPPPQESLSLHHSVSAHPTRYDHPSPLPEKKEGFARRRRSYSGTDMDAGFRKAPHHKTVQSGGRQHQANKPTSTKPQRRRSSMLLHELYAPQFQEQQINAEKRKKERRLTKHLSTIRIKDDEPAPGIMPIPIADSAFRELANQLRITDHMVQQVFEREWAELHQEDTPRTRTPF